MDAEAENKHVARDLQEPKEEPNEVFAPRKSLRDIDPGHKTEPEINDALNERRNFGPVASSDTSRENSPADESRDQPTAQTAKSAGDKPYSAFTQHEKLLIVLCATLGGLFSPFTTNIYFPALDTISRDLNVTISQVNLSITTYMIFQAIAPTFISTITDTQGRRPTYVIGFLIYIAANIGLGLNRSYAGLLVLRCLQSAGSSGMVTLQQSIIADIVTSAERGKFIGITSITGIVGPSVAPIIGGLLSQHLGWHSIFWFLLIFAGVYLVPMLLFMPETSRKIVGDGSILPPRWNMSLLNVWASHRRRRRQGRQQPKNDLEDQKQSSSPNLPPTGRAKSMKLKWPDPRATLVIFTEKESGIILIVSAISYAAWYGVSSSLTVQFAEIYHLNSTLQGLLFLPQAIGSLMSAVTNSIMLDRNYRRYARKLGVDPDRKRQISLAGFPIERVRLELTLPMLIANSLLTIVYGWFLEYEVPIAGPIVMLVFMGYTLMAGFNGLNVLNLDINRYRASSASAAGNLCRCLLGAGMTAVINPMILAMGRGWSFTFTALVQLAFLPGLWLCMRNGVRWRAEKEEKDRIKADARAEAAAVKEKAKEKKQANNQKDESNRKVKSPKTQTGIQM